ncbi:MAG TPA: fumarylacetoacetate hydrolase family protein [Blastocatellia bacterium]|nr:fumarylacetoacetate hydrolase family protein [Blastocatellia bacterium]
MKLLSMKIGGANHAGVVIGDEVLDVTAYIDSRGGARPREQPEPNPRLEDALDLFRYDVGALGEIVSRLEIHPDEAEACRQSGELLPLDAIKLNPPVLAPGKILAVGLNYAAHAAEQNIKPPETPLVFSKNVTALTAPNEPIQLPRASDNIDYEAELAFVIGREAKGVSADRALDYIAGYMIMNDVTARDLQAREKQWVRAKGLDTFAPCGPWLVTPDEVGDPHALDIELRVNGELRQQSNTSDLIFKIPQLVEFITQDLTLRPGDIISTGTPSGVGVFMDPPVYLKDGDEVEIKLAGVGELRNTVKARAER